MTELINLFFALTARRISAVTASIKSLAYARYVPRVAVSQLEALFATSPCLGRDQELMEKRRRKVVMLTPSLMNWRICTSTMVLMTIRMETRSTLTLVVLQPSALD